MGSHELPAGVGFTALVGAVSRAREADRSDPLFTDPLAERFVAATAGVDTVRLGPADPGQITPVWEGLYTFFGSRTPFFDENLMRFIDGGTRQIVLLGAGLDTRAYRLDLPPGTVVYEVDTPAVLDFKAAVLADDKPRCERVPVAIDLRDDWQGALLAAGFDPRERSVWLAEGLVMYLGAADAGKLVSGISSLSAAGSGLIIEVLRRLPVMADVPFVDEDERTLALVFIDNCRAGPGLPADWMTPLGWRVDRQVDFIEVLASQNRPVPLLMRRDPADPLCTVLAAGTKLRD
ncbi:SAM-dependent methyltransferase [Kibdelosporangium philippinense]|uniref:S-adenosyl-L-methionine-dependent methyltransferase n=1 Tax=Kibdelosporangium philippinense TaxID=211113 RepID=A0ABS8ZV95_9PSEU|nr:SAM-dependent methyltransferase [Kibdelosporangium philippinense]MCE7011618.1 SAM-dependent methyltransferase [Kibdelosporangium philippinense]